MPVRRVNEDRKEIALKGSSGGWGRDRTVDLTIFSRTLVPTELPSRNERKSRDPDGT